MNYDGKHVVVTGGAGAIGSRLVRQLLDAGAARVYVYDDLSSGFEWLLPSDPRVFLRKMDVAGLQALPEGCAVFHLAAHFANQNSVDDPFADLDTNALGTLRVLDAAARAKSPLLVFASAGCAAGREDTPYQIHKTLGEAYCRYFSDRVPTAVCRFHNSYGPGEVPGRYRNVIPNWIWAAMHDEPLTIYGDGTDARDFIFVEDLVAQMLTVSASRDPYVIGTGVLTKTADLARVIFDVTGSRSDVVYRPRRRWDHPGHAAKTALRCTVSLRDGIERTYAWMKKNDRIKRNVR